MYITRKDRCKIYPKIPNYRPPLSLHIFQNCLCCLLTLTIPNFMKNSKWNNELFPRYSSGSFIRPITDHMIEQKHIWSDKICLLDQDELSLNLLQLYCSLINTHFDRTKWYLIEQKLCVRSSWSELKFPYKWPCHYHVQSGTKLFRMMMLF